MTDHMLGLMRHPILVDTRNALADRTQYGNQLTLLTLGACTEMHHGLSRFASRDATQKHE